MILTLFASAPAAGGLFIPPWDKLAHFVVYGCIGGLFSLSFGNTRPLLALLLAGSVGAIDEAYQSVLPERSADLADLFFDIAAAALAILFCWRRSTFPVITPGTSGAVVSDTDPA